MDGELEVLMSFRKLLPILFLLAAACGRPAFGTTTESGAVIDTDVDRASANGNFGETPDEQLNNGAVGAPTDPSTPPLDPMGAPGLASDFVFDAYRSAAADGRNAVLAPHGLARSLVIAHAAAGPEAAAAVAAVVEPYLGGEIYSRFNSSDLTLDARQTDGTFQMLAGAWVQDDVEVTDDLVNILAMYLGVQLRLVDFASAPEDARNQINNWYSAQTAGRISEVLGARTLGADTRFVVTDATWFSAPWGFGSFDPDRTMYETFEGTEANVVLPMMMADVTLLHFGDETGLEAVVMPFDNGFSLIAVLPADLEGFEDALEPGLLDRIVNEATPAELQLQFPRLEVSDRVSLSSVADAIGVAALFDPAADYAGFLDGTQLDDAHQRTRISFSETGVDAATSNDGTPDPGMGGEGAPSAPAVALAFNRPFFFAVRDSASGRYLFLGRVAQP